MEQTMNPLEVNYPPLSRVELVGKMATGKITLIDANGTESYREGHIPGALDFEAESPHWPAGLPDDHGAPLVAYCGGPRCMAWKGAAKVLTGLGYSNVSHFPGGLLEWTEAKMPLETALSRNGGQQIGHSKLKATLPSCRLSPEAQGSRIGQLKSSLFRDIESIIEGNGALSFQFAGNLETVRALTDFIQFERECCSSLCFGMEWEPHGGPVTLVMKGPAPLLKALKVIAMSPAGMIPPGQ
jgi:rhodanese-related sulfurtransferase